MSYIELGKILMKWSLQNNEYNLAYYLYTEHNIGIPVTMLYALPEQRKFNSLTSFISNDKVICGSEDLNTILRLFPKSRYIRLEEWGGAYGYRF